jgi:hypothetical protein
MARRNTRLRDVDDLDEISSDCLTRRLCCWARSDWDAQACDRCGVPLPFSSAEAYERSWVSSATEPLT